MAKIHLPDKCSNCGKKHSKKFYYFKYNTILCNECNKKIGDRWQRGIDKGNFKGLLKKISYTLILVFAILFLFFLANYYFLGGYSLQGYNKEGYSREGYNLQGFNEEGYDRQGYDKEGYNVLGYDRQGYSKNPDNNEKVKKIAEEYHNSHTYSLPDFFVCSDMAIDVWNLIKTQGINAKICAGNIDSNIFEGRTMEYSMQNTNHAWTLAETSPMTYIAVETTGGYLVVYGENNLYYRGFCFENPAKFKKFLTLRDSYFQVCGEAEKMRNYWNENIADTPYTYAGSEYQGRMNAKTQECNNIISELSGLIT